jgi:hypothetical protein
VSEADLAIMPNRLHLEFPLCGRADVERPFGCRGSKTDQRHLKDADAADGDRGALSASAHDEAGTRAKELFVSAARQISPMGLPNEESLHYLPLRR